MGDLSGDMRGNLLKAFDGWSEDVVSRLSATLEEDIEQRDIYDRRPIFKWVEGGAALLGDSAHAMQPNMGQGGCQAIEDAYVLASLLDRVDTSSESSTSSSAIPSISVEKALEEYERKRCMRAAAIHGFARSAALMTTTWRPYLGSDPYDFYKYIPGMMSLWKFTESMRVPHPGKIIRPLRFLQVHPRDDVPLEVHRIDEGSSPGQDHRADSHDSVDRLDSGLHRLRQPSRKGG